MLEIEIFLEVLLLGSTILSGSSMRQSSNIGLYKVCGLIVGTSNSVDIDEFWNCCIY